MTEKPPLGLIPLDLWREQRMWEVLKAMHRYSAANKPCPVEWIDELTVLFHDMRNPKIVDGK